jgi:hypothetical protein
MVETPAKKRKAAERERMRNLGFKRFEAWVHEDDLARVDKLVTRLRILRTLKERNS